MNLLIAGDVDHEIRARKATEMRGKTSSLKLQLEAVDRSRDEMRDLASKMFELSQTLRQKWVTAEYAEKRRILGIVCLNFELDGVSLVLTMRKPFEILAEGFWFFPSRGDTI